MSDYQKTYQFGNGYGASVICNSMSYGGNQGLFEVAVLDAKGDLVYDTSVTNDVVGFLDFAGVADVLQKIQNLPKNTNV